MYYSRKENANEEMYIENERNDDGILSMRPVSTSQLYSTSSSATSSSSSSSKLMFKNKIPNIMNTKYENDNNDDKQQQQKRVQYENEQCYQKESKCYNICKDYLLTDKAFLENENLAQQV